MKRFIIILSLLSYLFPRDDRPAISIIDFTGEDVSDKLLRACYQKLETSLIESNRFTVIAKNQREQILEEMKFQSSGVCDEECAVEIGQLVGAEYLMLGEIIGFADLYQVNIKIVNIEKGDVVEKVTEEIEGKLPQLLKGMAESSREITRRIASGGEQIVTQQPGMEIAQKKYGSIIVESNPSGATVLIDNVKKGSTPLELNNIEVGTRKLKLIKTGYVTINKGIIINEETPVNVSEVFILKTGDLTITSDPTESMVYLNGAYQGKTPYTIRELTIGDYNVTVSSENYHDENERVIVEYDRVNSKNFILQPKPGKVTIIVTPQEAKISVGYKKYNADADGIASIELPVGRHKIDFRLKGYEPVTKNVTLSANEKKSLEVQMYLSKTEEKSDDSYVNNKPYKNRDETWFGLERGWVRDENEGGDLPNEGGDLPNYECNIIHETTGTTFTLINPSQNIYNFGDTYTVTLYSDTYSVGQQGGAILCLNENTVYNFGSWLVFDSNGQRDFTLPSESENIYPSNCYTIVVIGYNQQDEYVSEPITIY